MGKASQKKKKTIVMQKIEQLMLFIYGNIKNPQKRDKFVLGADIIILSLSLGLSSYNIFSATSEIVLFFGTVLYSARRSIDLYKRIFITTNDKEKIIIGGLLLFIVAMSIIIVWQFFSIKTIGHYAVKIPSFVLYLSLFFSDLFKIFKEFYKITD